MKLNSIFISFSTVIVILFIFPQTSDACNAEPPGPTIIKNLVCRTKADCEEPEECFNRKCTLKCYSSKCGLHASCYIQYGKEVCSCPKGYSGNPYFYCAKMCTVSQDCRSIEICRGGKCSHKCDLTGCGINATCEIRNNINHCKCPPGLTGDAYSECSQMCTVSQDCRSIEICRGGKCTHECDLTGCGINATCEIRNNINHCKCPPGLTGDAYSECSQMCTVSQDCRSIEICRGGKCTHECDLTGCGINATCEIRNNINHCKCPSGLTGDAYSECSQMCTVSQDCRSIEICRGGKCTHECDLTGCGINATCEIRNNINHCKCPPGLTGDAYSECSQSCGHLGDCGSSQICHNETCTSECDLTKCGVNATCEIINGSQNCICPHGTIGSPYHSCGKICYFDENCADAEVCDFHRQCVPVCDQYRCASNATCHVANHTRTCSCAAGLTGNPMYECKKVCDTNVECADHEKCNDVHQCIPVFDPYSSGAYASCSVVNCYALASCLQLIYQLLPTLP